MAFDENYNEKYSQKGFYWGLEPETLVVKSLNYLQKPPAAILDLGCGEGKDSFYLAKKGYDVTSVDISETGIKKLQEFAKENNLNIKAQVADINDYLKDSQDFDAIFCMSILQFMTQNTLPSTIENIKSKTKPSGLNIINSFIAENEEQKKKMLANGRYGFDPCELKERYKGWNILFYEEKLGDWETHGEKPHRHLEVRLISQKL